MKGKKKRKKEKTKLNTDMINYVNDYHYTRKEFLIVRGWYNFSIKKLNNGLI
jgi:hypothetical protein